MSRLPTNLYLIYHAHVYFDQGSLDDASTLCKRAGKELGITVGRIHTRNVGPHPHWSCQLLFNSEEFDRVISWLDSNRHGLNILVHGVTGNNLQDHTDHAAWLGDSSKLNLEIFK